MWAAILGFFVFGAIGWYAVVGAFLIWTFIIVEKDSFSGGIIELILLFLFLQFMGRMDIWGYVAGNPGWIALLILGYFVTGFAWSFLKWWLYVKEKAEKVRKERDKFLAENKNNAEGWRIPFDLNKPIAMEHKGGIAIWVIYWPFSLVWSFINDFIKRVVRQIITCLKGWYQGIAYSAYQGIEE